MSFIEKQIRRTNRNLLVTNAAIVLGICALALSNGRYLWNFVSGFKPISASELATAGDSRRETFVHVHGGKSFDTGLQFIEETRDKYSHEVKSQTVTANYLVTVVGKKLLIVKVDSNTGENSVDFDGELVPLPSDVYSQIVPGIEQQTPELRGTFLPMMLNANDFREDGYWQFGIGIPVLLVSLWNLFKWKRRVDRPESHPIRKFLQRYGEYELVAPQIDADLAKNPQKHGSTTVVADWMWKESFFNFYLVRYSDLVWIFKKVTQHRWNFIPTHKSFASVFYDRFGWKFEFEMNQEQTDQLLGWILGRFPWIVAGYNDELNKLWSEDAGGFVAAVDERRRKFSEQAAAAKA